MAHRSNPFIIEGNTAPKFGTTGWESSAEEARWVIEPVSGEELQAVAERIMVQPPKVLEQVKKILRVK